MTSYKIRHRVKSDSELHKIYSLSQCSANNVMVCKSTQTDNVSKVEKKFVETHIYVNKMPPNCSDPSETLLPETPRVQVKKPQSVEYTLEDDDNEEVGCSYLSYGIGDAVMSACVVAPQVVSVWRGTWGIMDLHPHLFPFAQTFLLGIIMHACFAVLKRYLLRRAATPPQVRPSPARWLRERLLSRGYTYLFILSNIMHWRGGWGLLDTVVALIIPEEKDPHRPVVIAAFTVVFYLTAISLRSSRNFLASPYFLVTDGKEPTYIFSTRFQNTNSRETALYVLDCIFSVGVVGSLVVFVWRGSWALLDIFLYPDDKVRSCWISLIAGYVIVVVTFGLQAPVRWAAARLHGAPRLLLADVYHLLSFLATVNVWRGIWGLLDVYFFPETPKLSNWCSHFISFSLLMVLNCSNTVLVRGVYIDAEEPAGECVVFPCHYLRLYFHKERTKKRHKRALAAAASAGQARRSEDASVPLQIPEEKV